MVKLARLGVLWAMKDDLERRIVTEADELKAAGFEWPELAAQTGTSRQNFTGWLQRRRATYSRAAESAAAPPAGDGQAA